MELDRETRRRQTHEEWGAFSDWFRFLDDEEERAADRERDALVAALGERAGGAFGGSKPHVGPLSAGCLRCGEGRWSCVFVTRECHATCALCPAASAPGEIEPWADGLTFPDFDDYLAYARALRITGVSFSGGDPLLYADRLVERVRRTRAALGPDAWIWAYTNGGAATASVLGRLAAAGLDELRFNVSAHGYRLDEPARAVGVVPTVTVEVPVIPEDEARLRAALGGMATAGVDHVNLHETMLYGMNAMQVRDRAYPLRGGLTPTLAEAEPAALRLLLHTADEGLELAVQYCAHVFKGRWQMRGNDARVSRLVVREGETVTAWGALRRVVETDAGPAFLYLRPQLVDAPAEGVENRTIDLDGGRRLNVILHPMAPPIPLTETDAVALAAGEVAVDSPFAPFELVGRGLAHGFG